MVESESSTRGYVYILEVADIDLPVCKIGMTSRDPEARCAEINKSSTGDFIWAVAHHVFVDDRIGLESLLHQKLAPLRQKRREFFNLCPEDALRAMRSILDSQNQFRELPAEVSEVSKAPLASAPRSLKRDRPRFNSRDAAFAELLDAFNAILKIKGRPFGQLSRPVFGISDDNKGVQWNLAVWTDIDQIQLGVNLEGIAYSNWPIARFIRSELNNPALELLKRAIERPDLINLRFVRDAWRVTARPEIVEAPLGGQEFTLAEMDPRSWNSMLVAALGCLDPDRQHQGRALQEVTLVKPPKGQPARRTMPVSPHLTLWTAIDPGNDLPGSLASGIARLRPVHDWVATASR